MTAKKEQPEATATPAPSPTRIWEELGKTDPNHTKGFKRQGGFSGTATKPIWMELRMTEYFGPCGLGWGTSPPQFAVERGADECFVFCTVGLWYVDPATAIRSDYVYGVGGDRFVTKGSSGIRTSDEAFKMAHTDAIGNAMKHIGVCADIHLGLFENSKYVDEMRQEFADEPEAVKPVTPPPSAVEVDDASAIPIIQAAEGSKSLADLKDLWERNADKLAALKVQRPDDYKKCEDAKNARKTHFTSQQKAA